MNMKESSKAVEYFGLLTHGIPFSAAICEKLISCSEDSNFSHFQSDFCFLLLIFLVPSNSFFCVIFHYAPNHKCPLQAIQG